MEVPRLGVESELQLSVYTTATATQDPSHICDLHHSSWQCVILDPLSGARDWARLLMDTSQVCSCCTTSETPIWAISNLYCYNVAVNTWQGFFYPWVKVPLELSKDKPVHGNNPHHLLRACEPIDVPALFQLQGNKSPCCIEFRFLTALSW